MVVVQFFDYNQYYRNIFYQQKLYNLLYYIILYYIILYYMTEIPVHGVAPRATHGTPTVVPVMSTTMPGTSELPTTTDTATRVGEWGFGGWVGEWGFWGLGG